MARRADGKPSGYEIHGICGDDDLEDGEDCSGIVGQYLRFEISVDS